MRYDVSDDNLIDFTLIVTRLLAVLDAIAGSPHLLITYH